jgi:hypothetical protein
LDALEDAEAVNVSSAPYAVTPHPTRADFVAARRAARRLAEAGQVRAIYRYTPTHDEGRFTPQLVVTRVDSDMQGDAEPIGGCPSWVTRRAEGSPVALSVRTIAKVMGVSASTVSRDARKRST